MTIVLIIKADEPLEELKLDWENGVIIYIKKVNEDGDKHAVIIILERGRKLYANAFDPSCIWAVVVKKYNKTTFYQKMTLG